MTERAGDLYEPGGFFECPTAAAWDQLWADPPTSLGDPRLAGYLTGELA
jgi:hypothetical protein